MAAIFGIMSILLSIPLFYKQVFFTAQHLTYYAVAFFALSVLLILKKEIYENRN